MAQDEEVHLIQLSKEQHGEIISKIQDLIYIMNQALRMILITLGLLLGFGLIVFGVIIAAVIIFYK